jgi:hypothetical protein
MRLDELTKGELISEVEMYRAARRHRLRRRMESEIQKFVVEEGGSEIRMKTQDHADSNVIQVNFTEAQGDQKFIIAITEIPQNDERFRVAPMQV